MRDLELRGAGNLLGTQQSGHIATVGYELYCALLEKAVRQLKNMPPVETVDVSIDLPVSAYFPRQYVTDMRTKIDLYRRLGRMANETELDDFQGELADRFGAVPAAVTQLVEQQRLRIWAHEWQILLDSPRGSGTLCWVTQTSQKIAELVRREWPAAEDCRCP